MTVGVGAVDNTCKAPSDAGSMAIILISRGTMSGVTPLTDSLSKAIGYRSVSREDLVARVNEHGEIANRIVESIGNATRAYEQFSRLRRPYVILMRLALLEYAEQDNLIYHGYSGHLLIPAFRHVLRVRINAPLPMRIRTTMAHFRCTEEEAVEKIQTEDENRGRWARFMYGRDIRHTGLYDLILNLQRMSVPAACRLLGCAANEPELQPLPETLQEVQELLLATRVEAALVTDSRTSTHEIEAKVKGQTIQLVGPYLEDDQRALVCQVAQSESGDKRVEYEAGCAAIFEPVIDAD